MIKVGRIATEGKNPTLEVIFPETELVFEIKMKRVLQKEVLDPFLAYQLLLKGISRL